MNLFNKLKIQLISDYDHKYYQFQHESCNVDIISSIITRAMINIGEKYIQVETEIRI